MTVRLNTQTEYLRPILFDIRLNVQARDNKYAVMASIRFVQRLSLWLLWEKAVSNVSDQLITTMSLDLVRSDYKA